MGKQTIDGVCVRVLRFPIGHRVFDQLFPVETVHKGQVFTDLNLNLVPRFPHFRDNIRKCKLDAADAIDADDLVVLFQASATCDADSVDAGDVHAIAILSRITCATRPLEV